MIPPYRGLDDPDELRRCLSFSPVLERIEDVELGSGPAWQLGRVGVLKLYPAYEIHDLPTDLMPDAAFRKIAFDFPDADLRGFATALAYAREGDRVYETIAGWVPVEGEHQLDEWITFLNAKILASVAAEAAKRAGGC